MGRKTNCVARRRPGCGAGVEGFPGKVQLRICRNVTESTFRDRILSVSRPSPRFIAKPQALAHDLLACPCRRRAGYARKPVDGQDAEPRRALRGFRGVTVAATAARAQGTRFMDRESKRFVAVRTTASACRGASVCACRVRNLLPRDGTSVRVAPPCPRFRLRRSRRHGSSVRAGGGCPAAPVGAVPETGSSPCAPSVNC
jgi:hypothetical protein